MQPRLSVTCRNWGSLCFMITAGFLSAGCPDDMQNQPAFTSQEAPRRHSPEGSVPQMTARSRVIVPSVAHGQASQGARLFAINCAHCHGQTGAGDGPVAGFLPELPANLHAPAVQQKPDAELYEIVTKGEHAMPAFEKFLSPDERWALVSFLRSLEDQTASSHRLRNQSGGNPER